MKKLLIAFAMLLGVSSFATAQTPAAAQATKPAATKSATAKPAAKAAEKPAAKPAATASNGVVLKKDGTPDKRYKNAPAGPLKKDGTPDKRYKANKKS